MKFEQVYDLLTRYQRERGGWYAVLGEQALRDIYQHIIATRAKDCLELGTAFGATACVMAAAVEENGGGTVTTIDHIARKPVGITQLAQMTGLTRYVRAIELKAGYNWFLLGVLREQTKGDVCARWSASMGTGCARGSSRDAASAPRRLAADGRSAFQAARPSRMGDGIQPDVGG
jgi:Methyltransferase domain